MDIKKVNKFNKRMARPKFSRGGYIKKIGSRKYFDDGGIATNATDTGVGGPGNPTNTNGHGIGGITDALGLNAQSANIQQGTNSNQLNNAYTGANNAINAQVGVTNTLTPGVQTGVNTQNQIENQELGIANGTGPNPAENQLAQATGTNVNNEAALLAGQRGASGNVGLAARNIGQQGAATEQAAVGQGATLAAQQEIAAQNNAAGIANQQVTEGQGATTALNTTQQNEQNILQNANTSANNAAVSSQSNINNVNAQANQGILGGITSGLSAVTGGLFAEGGKVSPHGKYKLEFVHKMAKLGLENYSPGGEEEKPMMADGGQIQANPLISGITNPPQSLAPQQPGYTSSSASGGPGTSAGPSGTGADLGKAASSGFAAGQAWKEKQGNPLDGTDLQESDGTEFGGSQVGDSGVSALPGAAASSDFTMNAYHGGEIWNMHPSQHANYSATHFANYFAKGGEAKDVPAMVSPGEIYLPPDAVERVKHGADPLKEGMRIPGQAKVKGDSLKNDTVPATLKEGGVVIDRKNVGHSDKARLFVLKSLKATGKHMKKPRGA